MGKISIRISNINAGLTHFDYGVTPGDQWVSKVGDIRDSIVNPFTGENPGTRSAGHRILHYFQPLKAGYILAVISIPSDPNRRGDNIGAFIHVPYDLDIPTSKIGDIIDRIQQQITSDNGYDPRVIEQLVSEEYPTREFPFVLPSQFDPNAEKVAVVAYDSHQFVIYDFVGDKIYQADNFKYAKLIFADREQWRTVPMRFIRVSSYQPGKLCIVSTAKPNAEGFRVSIDSLTVKSSVYMPINSKAVVKYNKNPYSPVKKELIIDKADYNLPSPLDSELRVEYTISETAFTVLDSRTSKPISNARIYINGNPARDGQWKLEGDNATFTVEAKGYEPKSTNTTREELQKGNHIVKLGKEQYCYKFRIPLKDGGSADFEINSEKEITKSPIEGYELDKIPVSGLNYPAYLKPKKSIRGGGAMTLRTKLLTGGISFLAGMLLGILCLTLFGGKSNTPETTEPDPEPIVVVLTPEQIEAQRIADFINYLDTSDTWKKEDFDKYNESKLFDAIYNCKLDEIIRLGSPYTASQNLSHLISCVQERKKDVEAGKTLKADIKNLIANNLLTYDQLSDIYEKEWEAPQRSSNGLNSGVNLQDREPQTLADYLDSHDKWERSDLQKWGADDLYEALVTAQLDIIISYGNNYNSKKLNDLVKIIKKKMGDFPNMKPIRSRFVDGDSFTYDGLIRHYNNDRKWVNPIKATTIGEPTESPQYGSGKGIDGLQ